MAYVVQRKLFEMKADSDFCLDIMIAEVSVAFRLRFLPASAHCKKHLKVIVQVKMKILSSDSRHILVCSLCKAIA